MIKKTRRPTHEYSSYEGRLIHGNYPSHLSCVFCQTSDLNIIPGDQSEHFTFLLFSDHIKDSALRSQVSGRRRRRGTRPSPPSPLSPPPCPLSSPLPYPAISLPLSPIRLTSFPISSRLSSLPPSSLLLVPTPFRVPSPALRLLLSPILHYPSPSCLPHTCPTLPFPFLFSLQHPAFPFFLSPFHLLLPLSPILY